MTGEAFGPYRLESLLGRGGMGEVWRAVDTSHGDRRVAIKVLKAGFGGDEDFTRRFRRECALVANLTGPHIIPIHSYGEIDGRLYIDMPLVDGVDLDTRLRSAGPLPPEHAVNVVDQLADALDTAHRAGLVHRDVKPSNVLLTGQGDRAFAYLIDFGIARAVDGTTFSQSGAVIGTYAYMAPERFDGGGDHRGDVYALGCVLHEALTGHAPFEATSLPAYMKAHVSAPPPRPSAARPELPAALDDVVARATAARSALQVSPAAVPIGRLPPLVEGGPVVPPPLPQTRISLPPAAAPVAPARPDRTVAAAAPTDLLRPQSPPAGLPARAPQPHRRRPGFITASVLLVLALAATALVVALGPTPNLVHTLTGHTGSVFAVAVGQLDDHPVIVSGSRDNTVRVWDLATGAQIGKPLTGHTNTVNSVAVGRLDGRPVIVSGSDDKTVRVWDMAARADS